MAFGVRQHVLQLLFGLRERGWEVDLVVSLDRADPAFHAARPALEAAGIRVFPLLMRRNPLSPDNAIAAFRLRRWLRRMRPDVVHTHSAIAGAVGRVAAVSAGVPTVIYSPHGGSLHEGLGMAGRVYAAIERLLAKRTGAIILVSEWLRGRCATVVRCAPEQMIVVPIGIDVSLFPEVRPEERQAARAQLGLDPDTVFFLCIGFIRKTKGQDVLVKAFERLRRIQPGCKLFLVGEGEMRGELVQRVRQLGMDSDVVFTGFVDDVRTYMRAADVYVHPTRADAGPYAPLEAMACNLPVVGTSVGAIPDFVENGRTGLLVPTEDDRAMSDAMALLVSNTELRRRMADAARQSVLQRFNLEQMVHNTERVYLQCLGATESRSFAGQS